MYAHRKRVANLTMQGADNSANLVGEVSLSLCKSQGVFVRRGLASGLVLRRSAISRQSVARDGTPTGSGPPLTPPGARAWDVLHLEVGERRSFDARGLHARAPLGVLRRPGEMSGSDSAGNAAN